MRFMHHQRCEIDRRPVRVRLTEKGRNIREIVDELFSRHAKSLDGSPTIEAEPIHTIIFARACRTVLDGSNSLYLFAVGCEVDDECL